jgi:hypothetical protein
MQNRWIFKFSISIGEGSAVFFGYVTQGVNKKSKNGKFGRNINIKIWRKRPCMQKGWVGGGRTQNGTFPIFSSGNFDSSEARRREMTFGPKYIWTPVIVYRICRIY